MIKDTANLGVPQFLNGTIPEQDSVTLGWYDSGRRSHRSDGRHAMSDFLPSGMLTNQTKNEEFNMATSPSTKTPGANLGTPANAKKGLNNLNKHMKTGSKAPNPGNSLK